MNLRLLSAAAALALSTQPRAMSPPHYPIIQAPKGKKCLLPDCTRLTLHNGGYCCREHCQKHRERIKGWTTR